MTQLTFRVAYGYNQTFDLTEEEAQVLIKAKEQNAEVVKFGNKVLSTRFTWIVPIAEIEKERLNTDELNWAEDIAEWLARPIHELNWEYKQTLNYAKKLVKSIGTGEVERLWNEYAQGTYPSAKKFLSAAKEKMGSKDDTEGNLLLLDNFPS